jgi:hypothetical protein
LTPAPIVHLALIRHGKLIGNREVSFIGEAMRWQMIDVARAWGADPPGVFVYDAPQPGVPHIDFVDTDGDPDALASHFEVAGLPCGDVDVAQSGLDVSTAAAHEGPELWGNPHLDKWVKGPNGLWYAQELCDWVQAQSYPISVEILGERRDVEVSNWLRPAAFGLPNPDGSTAFDFMETLSAPFDIAPGGYAVAVDDNGDVRYLAGAGGAKMSARTVRPTSRVSKLIEAGKRFAAARRAKGET